MNSAIPSVLMFLMLGIVFPVYAGKPYLPHGWRLPLGQEIEGHWRDDDPEKYVVVRGDFNGDGAIDVARLLVRQSGNGAGLYAFISRKHKSPKAYLLDEMKHVAILRAMGIAKALPGKYKTACGKGYWECEEGEAPEVLLRHDSINYFKTESANSFYYWDNKTAAFKRIWISD